MTGQGFNGEADTVGVGHKADADTRHRIFELLKAGFSYGRIVGSLKTTRPTISRALKDTGLSPEYAELCLS
jgi:DNA-binding transcriptional ArsR family regulator